MERIRAQHKTTGRYQRANDRVQYQLPSPATPASSFGRKIVGGLQSIPDNVIPSRSDPGGNHPRLELLKVLACKVKRQVIISRLFSVIPLPLSTFNLIYCLTSSLTLFLFFVYTSFRFFPFFIHFSFQHRLHTLTLLVLLVFSVHYLYYAKFLLFLSFFTFLPKMNPFYCIVCFSQVLKSTFFPATVTADVELK